MRKLYYKEKTEFFQKSTPVVALMLLVLAVSLEVLYRAMGLGNLPGYITAVNFMMLLFVLIIYFLHTRLTILNAMVCPALTILTFLYLSFVDYDYTVGSIYYS